MDYGLKNYEASGKNSMPYILPLPSNALTVLPTVSTFFLCGHQIHMGEKRDYILNGEKSLKGFVSSSACA